MVQFHDSTVHHDITTPPLDPCAPLSSFSIACTDGNNIPELDGVIVTILLALLLTVCGGKPWGGMPRNLVRAIPPVNTSPDENSRKNAGGICVIRDHGLRRRQDLFGVSTARHTHTASNNMNSRG